MMRLRAQGALLAAGVVSLASSIAAAQQPTGEAPTPQLVQPSDVSTASPSPVPDPIDILPRAAVSPPPLIRGVPDGTPATKVRHDGPRPRRGLFLGCGTGAGALIAGISSLRGPNPAPDLVLDFRAGGGLNERLLLMREIIIYAALDGSRLTAWVVTWAVQFFLVEDFYLRAGIGVAGASTGGPAGTGFGFSLMALTGYEKRFGNVFALAIEGGVTYSRFATFDALAPAVQVAPAWYF